MAELSNLFGALGTNDHSVLIKQFQSVTGVQDVSIAMFYLEANLFSLQNALGSYYESAGAMHQQHRQQQLEQNDVHVDGYYDDNTIGGHDYNNDMNSINPNHSMYSIAPCVSFTDLDSDSQLVLRPRTEFIKQLLVCNVGTIPWPVGCYLAFCSGQRFSGSNSVTLPVLQPGEKTTIYLPFEAPMDAGVHASDWRFYYPAGAAGDVLFGEPVWIVVTVDSSAVVAGQLGDHDMMGLMEGLCAHDHISQGRDGCNDMTQ